MRMVVVEAGRGVKHVKISKGHEADRTLSGGAIVHRQVILDHVDELKQHWRAGKLVSNSS